MIFRNKDIKPEKYGYLICDDLLNADIEPMPKELLENMPIPQRGKVFSVTFGRFNSKEFEKISGGLKYV
ncbi:MAG: hypothetical protein HFH48_03760 [Lachnospiraceae bacterium]|jgi:hypothetical protein|nr:hypothetical protein [Lachnospiraceae bacterium]